MKGLEDRKAFSRVEIAEEDSMSSKGYLRKLEPSARGTMAAFVMKNVSRSFCLVRNKAKTKVDRGITATGIGAVAKTGQTNLSSSSLFKAQYLYMRSFSFARLVQESNIAK